MKTLVAALVCLAAVATAVPVPSHKASSVKSGKAADPQRYYTYPLDPPPGGIYGYSGPALLPAAPVAYHQQQPVAPMKQFLPMTSGPAEVPQVTLMLSVPAVVPPGTSVTLTVQVANSNPQAGTVVSVSNPVVSATGDKPSTGAAGLTTDAVVVDANAASGPSIIDSVAFPDDLDNREPPFAVNLPFENPKDSPVLIALQEEAIKQQMLAALKNRKIA